MSSKIRKKKKQVFHSPSRTGVIREIPETVTNQMLSALSLAVQIVLLVFGVYAAIIRSGSDGMGSVGLSGDKSLLYAVFPLVSLVLSAGFRLACRCMPLEMWRLPSKVRQGFLMTEGTLLKLITLLLELELAICFFYIDLTLYLGYVPSDTVMLLWTVLLLLSVYLPGRYAAELADGRRKLPEKNAQKRMCHKK